MADILSALAASRSTYLVQNVPAANIAQHRVESQTAERGRYVYYTNAPLADLPKVADANKLQLQSLGYTVLDQKIEATDVLRADGHQFWRKLGKTDRLVMAIKADLKKADAQPVPFKPELTAAEFEATQQ